MPAQRRPDNDGETFAMGFLHRHVYNQTVNTQ